MAKKVGERLAACEILRRTLPTSVETLLNRLRPLIALRIGFQLIFVVSIPVAVGAGTKVSKKFTDLSG
jgi:hypothetical protein